MRKYIIIILILLLISCGKEANITGENEVAEINSDSAKISALKEIDPDLLEMEEEGRQEVLASMLVELVEASNRKYIEILLKAGVDVNMGEDFFGRKPVHIAVDIGNEEIIKLLIDSGADVGSLSRDGQTPLHVALENGNYTVARYLIEEEGADFNLPDAKGRTPVFYVCQVYYAGVDDMLEYLIKKGVKLNVIDGESKTPLDLAMYGRKKSIADILKENGAENRNFKPSVALAAYYWDVKEVKELVEEGYDINASDEDGNCGLTYAAIFGKRELVEYLIANGAEVDIYNRDLKSPFYWAVLKGHKNIAEILLANGAELDTYEIRHNTLLHITAKNGDIGMVEWLLSKGCEVNQENSNKQTPLDIAENDKIKTLLKSHGAVSGRDMDK